MASKKNPQAKAVRLGFRSVEGESFDRTSAREAQKPQTTAAITALRFNQLTEGIDANHIVSELDEQAKAVVTGDLSRAEEMLISQAHVLDAIFHDMARRAALNLGSYLNASETYMRLALKAQGQCRATLQTLAELKAPKQIAFIKQANVANGPQQVNNGTVSREEKTRPTNKVLEPSDGQWLDTRTQGAAIGAHSQLAAVEALHGAPN